jgi:hypothetical protein
MISLSCFGNLLYKMLIYFYKDFFRIFKNGQKKCPNFENGNKSSILKIDETINFFSVSQVFEKIKFVTTKFLKFRLFL